MDASPKMSVLSFAQSVLLRNNFMVMNIPSYVNFYNVQDAVKNPKPRPEGTLEFANTLFGTFLNVDYRDSSSKMVCFFISKPSEHLAINKNVDYRFKDDAFDLRKTSNPLVENQVGKTDWDKSNKVVGFNVDIGTQNQQIFQSFDVSQEAGTSTAESLEVINQMANQSGNRGGATQNLSLYNIYKNRSYKCKIMMMGNAMIQPSMYFNLRYVPMFSGPYMILDVTHNIVPGMFHTTITGIRQPTASLPKVDQFVQTIRTNLLKIIKDKLKVESSSNTPQVAQSTQNVTNTNAAAGTSNSVTSPTLTTGPTSNTTTNSIDQLRLLNYELNNSPASTKSANQECVSNSDYASYTKAEIVKKEFNLTQMYEIVNSVLNLNGGANIKLAHTIYAFIWLNSNGSAAGFSSNNFNFGGIDLTSSWGQSGESNFLKEYFCSTDNVPYASFQNTDKFVTFLSNRWRSRVATISEDNYKEITKFIILNSKQNIKPETIYEDMDIVDLGNIESQVQSAIFAYDQVNRQSATSTEPTQLLSITRTSVGDPKFVVTVNNTNNEKWVMIVAEYKVTSPSECSQTDYQYNISNLISSDKQSLSISLEDIQLDSDCSDTPVESVKFRVTLNPVLSDGVTLDNSRSQTVQYISGNF
jgi:hypothetical protein